jgi:hypothetical protein
VADCALDVLDEAAADAYGVVVVISHPRFIQRRRVRRLKPAQHVQVGQVTEDHIDGLRRQLGQLLAGSGENALGGGMRMMFDGGQHGEALLRHPAAVGTQGGGPCVVSAPGTCHGSIQALIMISSQ